MQTTRPRHMNTYFNGKVERIICPFDFTETGTAGLDYAGALAAALGATVTIFYVQPSIWPEALQLYDDLNDENRAIRRHLHLEALRVESAFGVSCDYAIEPATEASVGAMSVDYDLIVIGSNGADDLYQHVFGLGSYHAMGLAKCPVLIIPDGHEAAIPKQIVYAFDPEKNPALVSQLAALAKPLNAEVQTLNVVPDIDVREAERKMELLGDMLGVKEPREFDWGFAPSYSDAMVSFVDSHMKENRPGILALSYHHRTLFEKLFQDNVFKPVSRIADYPILVFWH